MILPKNHNATSGKKAHNDNKYYVVGRIKYRSWATAVLKVRDIIVYESELVHIYNDHKKELSKIGMTAFDFVNFIIDNYNEIREGTKNSVLLVVRRENISNYAALELFLAEKEMYKIKTATPIKNAQLLKKKLLCANDH